MRKSSTEAKRHANTAQPDMCDSARPSFPSMGVRSLLRLGSSQRAMVTAGALAISASAASGMVATSPLHAQSAESLEIGDTVQDPSTGDRLRVIAVRDGAVIGEG